VFASPKAVFLLAVVMASASAPAAHAAPACAVPAWRVMYRHDAAGRPIAGSRDALLAALRRGDPLRVAWGASFAGAEGAPRSVEHSADAVFVTIVGGREVVAQSPEHIAQAGYQDEAAATFGVGSVVWRGLFSTTGRFDAVWVDRATGREVRRLRQQAAIAWLAFAPEPRCETRAPLDLAVEDGVQIRAP
jgi:hypothetical protein